MVLSYHGYGDNDAFQELITGFSEPGVQINGKVRYRMIPIVGGSGLTSLLHQDIIAVYPAGAYGPGANFNQLIRAWQGAPYSPVSRDIVLGGVGYSHDLFAFAVWR
jgi:hypothetical protein